MKYSQHKIKGGLRLRSGFLLNERIIRKVVIAISAPSITLSLVATPFLANAESRDTAFQVNVRESLSVSITSQITPTSGNVDTFLRNKYTLNVSSNNTSGFTASMYSVGTTNLTNTAINNQTIPTLASSSTRGNFPANYWGYSLGTSAVLNNNTYNETEPGNANSNYYPLVSTSATPITVLTSSNSGSGSQDIYFGAKANTSKAAGTYSGIVVISVVSGVIDNTNPITPENPVGPNTKNDDEVAKYTPAPSGGSSNGVTTYTYRRSNASAGTTTTTTQVSDGDNRDSYSGYTPPQGVVESSTTNTSNDSSLAAGLATTATVAAATGMFFFILAKRREDDDDEEDQI